MNPKLNGLALGVSAVALLVASLGLRSTITQARLMDPGVQGDLLRSTEVIRVRVDDLERQNAELRVALRTAQTRLQKVESVYASSEVGMAAVSDRIAKLEDSSAETGRAVFRFGSTLMATRQALGLTNPELEGEADADEEDEDEDEDEEPKLEDYLRIEMNPINGLPGPHIIIEGANLHVRSGSGATDDFAGALYGLGNVVVGYNEYDPTQLRARTGSHNLIVGNGHGYTSFGGLLAGYSNEVSAPNASVSGGTGNHADGWASSISGGERNLTTGESSSVAGGIDNQAEAKYASVTGGSGNVASGWASSVTGGAGNQTITVSSAISGGLQVTLDTDSPFIWSAGGDLGSQP